ncbi:PREDICTED: uncharacterized protein LOC105454933 [Wasmannia auropunctata]|uniref:uncharacterized protein LOC105454933 n=1 Tax=Wasmannia auropunctata TaxID=64793 RepID=UPI0005EE1AA6|nr:PREDICTED: uncharacterized protein LOC105454933 [Wasmannia auropunctata]XP_011696215.1 PREDICTED: uncharacterized protein LOC105454933 [Wasmannia auropunctata]
MSQVSIFNENNEKITISFTSDEELENMQLENKIAVAFGFIDEIEGPKIVGTIGTRFWKLLKFILNNNSQHRISVLAWDENVDRIEHLIQLNQVVRVIGANARIRSNKYSIDYNIGNLPYELIVYDHTVIENLGPFERT